MKDELFFDDLLVRTAFACMVSDGDIDPSEVDKLKELLIRKDIVPSLKDFEEKINYLVEEINRKGIAFLREYLAMVEQANLTVEEEVRLVFTAVSTIKADGEERYSEIKFFKLLRSKLRVDDNTLIKELPQFHNLEEDYLQEDILSESYVRKLTQSYLDSLELPHFDSIRINKDKD